ncbi:hypothetical protein Lfu02_59930 [Longispora fulva]|uniref:Uncharacterized protein n=1 Tax=Longispora fulva TaxID=619741 RepID=A0A8J7KG66_9ACTN|nr:hypothetical protein [Longispora fulva]MBG6137025.1 hypothetical protein [Longispora fulva]GIG61621.1 hypothetical protein Lfu02_59930 [Longispora fulva]
MLVRISAGAHGRLVLTGLRIDGEPSAELLRAIPVGRIEAAANAQLAIVDDRVVQAAPLGPKDRSGPARPPHTLDAGWETSDPGRAARRPTEAGSARLAHDGSGRRPDEFYRDVARAYRDLAQSSHRPAAELAAANGVPATTAHRWIKEARRRGFLPPGRPGKAG